MNICNTQEHTYACITQCCTDKQASADVSLVLLSLLRDLKGHSVWHKHFAYNLLMSSDSVVASLQPLGLYNMDTCAKSCTNGNEGMGTRNNINNTYILSLQWVHFVGGEGAAGNVGVNEELLFVQM